MVNITFLPEICIVGQNTLINCSRITVAHVDVKGNILSKIQPAHNLNANRIKPGITKMTDKHTAEHSNTACFKIVACV